MARLIRLILVIIKSTSASLITRVGARNYAFVTTYGPGFANAFSACWPARSNKYFITLLCGTRSFPRQLPQWDLKLKCGQIGSDMILTTSSSEYASYPNFGYGNVTIAHLTFYRYYQISVFNVHNSI